MAGTTSGGDFGVNVGGHQIGRAIGSGGLLQRRLRLERTLSDLVNQTNALTPAEIALS